MATAAVKSVPEGTETEAWREMSARVAWLFWLTKRRAELPADKETEAAIWDVEAEDFRSYTRKVLRALLKDGVRIDGEFVGDAVEEDSEEWKQLSAKIAWRFWLVARRADSVADQEAEAAAWEVEAPSYRKMTRTALKTMANNGFVILA